VGPPACRSGMGLGSAQRGLVLSPQWTDPADVNLVASAAVDQLSSERPTLQSLVGSRLCDSAQPRGQRARGLRNMSSDVPEVHSLLSSLSVVVSSCSDPLNAQNVGNTLYGLHHMSSDVPEVRSLLSSLSVAVSSCSEPLNAQNVGNALYGLQCMSSDVSEVRSLLSLLSAVVSSCSEPLDAQAVGNALYGLQCMSSDVPEVRSLLSSLSVAVSSCSEPLDAQAVGNALYGLQGVRSCEGGAVLMNIISNVFVVLWIALMKVNMGIGMQGEC
jgi:hypothetical protein